jgi:hypothetical protein
LLEFANRGGGLWWFVGHQVDPNVYNHDFFDAPTRLLPARLGPRFDRTEMPPVAIQWQGADHPLFTPFSGQGQEMLAGVRVRRLLTTESASWPPTTRVLMALPDGRPLLFEGKMGRGRVLMFTSTADADWNELPVTTAYLPLIQTGVMYLSGRETGHRAAADVRIPHPVTVQVAEVQREIPVTISDPHGKETRLFPQDRNGQVKADHTAARVPGFYRVRLGQETALVAVNTPLEESDVTSIQLEEVPEKFPGISFAMVPWERGNSVRPPQVEPMSLAGWFLIGLLVLMLVEGVFANRLR